MFSKIGGAAALTLLPSLLLAGCPKPVASPSPVVPEKPVVPAVPAEIRAVLTEPLTGHDPSTASPLLDVMTAENARWMKTFRASQAPAYYLAYSIHDKQIIVLGAESGALTVDANETHRALDVEVRVGNPQIDNRHPIQDQQVARVTGYQQLGIVPKGQDPKAIAHHLWLETDKRFREAALTTRIVMTEGQIRNAKDLPPDFSHEKPENFIQPVASLEWNRSDWEERMRECSKQALKGVATRASCRVYAELNTIYYVNSEGSVIQKSWTTSRLELNVGVKADDGMPLSRLEQSFAPTVAGLPGVEEQDKLIERITTDLDDLHKAPIVTPWAGPVILEGRAAAVFFHEVFGHRIEGHRQKNPTFGKTFTEMVGKRIMPEWLTVYDDPRIRKLNDIYLNGFFHFDDEGVRAQRAPLVDKGVLKGFVMGRSPIDGFPSSNGHGRAEAGLPAVARQGNLVAEASRTVEKEELYKQLVEEVKAQGKEFGMVFTDISGGFTNTSTFSAQSFKVQPIMAYRVYADGRKELVRGVDISGLPLSVLDSVMAAGRPLETFNGMCGAESGWVPVSASAPSLLVKTLEVERGYEPDGSDPVLPPPPTAFTSTTPGAE
ncbi:MAG: peptidase U62 [Myxococcales bacterium]|nr:peptidase U62 [Myxococcales bacterium]